MTENITLLYLRDALLHKWRDPEVKDYFLMSSPTAPAAIIIFYLATIFSIGPKFMENRKPMNLKFLMTVYNIVQVYLNAKLVLLAYDYIRRYCLACTLNDLPVQAALDHLELFHFYILMKFFDLLDTLFIVFRKRYQQITGLHLHHHLSMSVGGWIVLSLYPRSCCTYLTMINSFVHVIMYFYYLMTIHFSGLKNVMWLKRSITQMQITQHVSVMAVHLFLMATGNCLAPIPQHFIFIINLAVMIGFFTDYYYNAYIKRKEKTK